MNKELIQRIASGEAAPYELEAIKLADVHAIKADPELQQRRFIVEKAAGVDTGKRRVSGAVMSTETQDRMGDIIKLAGWELENFKANPQLLWAHDSHSLPIGTPTKVRRGRTSKGVAALMSDEEYHTAEENPHAELVFRLVAKGALPGRSVGFRGIDVQRPASDAEREKLGLGAYGVVYVKSELLENSVVPIPANQLALQEKALGIAREVYNSGCEDIPREVVKSVFDSLAFTEQDAVRIAREVRRRSIVMPELGEEFAKEIAGAISVGGEEKGEDVQATEPETVDPVAATEDEISFTLAPDADLDEFVASVEGGKLLDLYRRVARALDERLATLGLSRADIADAPPVDSARLFSEALETISRANENALAKMGETIAKLAGASEAMTEGVSDALEQIREHLTDAERAQGYESTSAASAGEADTETDSDDVFGKLLGSVSFDVTTPAKGKADTE